MKKIILLSVMVSSLFFCNSALGQENENNFGIKFSGFVKNDFFFDSRQTVAAREGHFLLWPSAESNDINGNDLNAKANFNFLAIQSRLSGAITGPDAFGAKTSGVIEGDFFAQANDNINLFRLRHAFVKLKWTNTEVITGQYWNPLFVTGCFPGTVSFNTGVPFQSFARNPQVRLTHSSGNFKFIAAALSQRDYVSYGMSGASSSYLRNSSIPDLHFQLHYDSKTETSSFLVGAGIAIKSLVPRLSSYNNYNTYQVDETVSSMTAIAFTKVATSLITLKLQGRYGENNTDLLAISGFAVKDIEDATTGELSYTPLKNITFWGEIHTNGKTAQFGVFAGVLKNQGTKEEMSSIDNAVYGLGTNIESLTRISPRVLFISNKTKIGCELEVTSAAYGSNYNSNYVPDETTSVTNVRLLLSVIYSF